jgi:hypothetical protein
LDTTAIEEGESWAGLALFGGGGAGAGRAGGVVEGVRRALQAGCRVAEGGAGTALSGREEEVAAETAVRRRREADAGAAAAVGEGEIGARCTVRSAECATGDTDGGGGAPLEPKRVAARAVALREGARAGKARPVDEGAPQAETALVCVGRGAFEASRVSEGVPCALATDVGGGRVLALDAAVGTGVEVEAGAGAVARGLGYAAGSAGRGIAEEEVDAVCTIGAVCDSDAADALRVEGEAVPSLKADAALGGARGLTAEGTAAVPGVIVGTEDAGR